MLSLLFFCSSGADALTVEVQPQTVVEGDVYVVQVLREWDEVISQSPVMSTPLGEVFFSPCAEHCYEAVGVMPIGTQAGAIRVTVTVDSKQFDLDVKVRQGEFETQHLTLPSDKVTLSPEDEARTDREAARLKALWKILMPAQWEGPFIMPLGNSYSTEFGVMRIMNETKQSRHSGIDIRGAYDEPVLAANSGTVALAEDTFYGGNTLVVDHGAAIYSVYMHLKRFAVSEGKVVGKGEVIGYVGSTGRSTGPHLHYTLKVQGENANPESATRLPLRRHWP